MEDLEWAAKWIEGSLTSETDDRVIKFGKNMAMTLRAELDGRPSAPVPLTEELLRRGRECAVSLTGDPDDAAEIDSPEKAWAAIDEALAMGKQRCDELNELNMAMVPLAEDRAEAEKLIDGWNTTLHSPSDHDASCNDLLPVLTTFAARVRAEQREVDVQECVKRKEQHQDDALAANSKRGQVNFYLQEHEAAKCAEAIRRGGK